MDISRRPLLSKASTLVAVAVVVVIGIVVLSVWASMNQVEPMDLLFDLLSGHRIHPGLKVTLKSGVLETPDFHPAFGIPVDGKVLIVDENFPPVAGGAYDGPELVFTESDHSVEYVSASKLRLLEQGLDLGRSYRLQAFPFIEGQDPLSASTCARLRDGSTVSFGGNTANDLAHAIGKGEWSSAIQRFDGKQWITLPQRGLPMIDAACAVLPDGNVLVAGGRVSNPTPVRITVTDETHHTSGQTRPVSVCHPGPVISFDARQNSLKQIGNLQIPRLNPTLTTLPSGKVLIAGGDPWRGDLHDPLPCEIWSSAGVSTLGKRLLRPGFNHDAVILSDGSVLIIGGKTYYWGKEVIEPSIELYKP